MEDLAIGITMITLVLTFGSVINGWLRGRREERVAEMRVKMQTELLNRFQTSEDVLSYLESDAGAQFAESAALGRANAVSRLLGSLQVGIVATFVGTALFALQNSISDRDVQEGMAVFGAVGMALGLGFVVSAGVGLFLTRRLGLFPSRSSQVKIEG